MTYDVHEDAPASSVDSARQLHEFAVNQLGIHTDHCLFTACSDGTVTGEISTEPLTQRDRPSANQSTTVMAGVDEDGTEVELVKREYDHERKCGCCGFRSVVLWNTGVDEPEDIATCGSCSMEFLTGAGDPEFTVYRREPSSSDGAEPQD